MEGICVDADFSLHPGVSVPGALKVLLAGLPALLLALADAVQEQLPGQRRHTPPPSLITQTQGRDHRGDEAQLI